MSNVYNTLLSSSRIRSSSVGNRNIIAEAESDRGRLLFCPAFRRLQQKAQVFSMEPNAAVRSRLTHSFEVSQMGRYIADTVSPRLVEAGLATVDQCNALVTFVETACLMHDIGNPPFGHFGEAAIAEWFDTNGAKSIIKACGQGKPKESLGTGDPRVKSALADFLEFDGNPQGLRVVAKLQRNSDPFGLNLTKTSIAAYLKYIRQAGDPASGGNNLFTKKAGYFSTEKKLVDDVWSQFGYNKPQRFPLAYMMEAADDLAYCISDLEDSIEKQLLNQKVALSDLVGLWSKGNPDLSDDATKNIDSILRSAANGKLNERPFTYTDFRTALNREIVAYCSEQYVTRHTEIVAGTAPPLLGPTSGPGKVLQLLKDYCRTHVYRHESVQRVELGGYTAIYGLLEKYSCLLDATVERFSRALDYSQNKDETGRPIVIEKKLLALFPKNYLSAYHDDLSKLEKASADFPFHEWNLRAHLVTDFLSGMTDDFAMTTYRTLSGMRL